MDRDRDHDFASGPLAAASGTANGAHLDGTGDPLSDVLEAVRLTGALFFTVEAAPPWVAEAPQSSVLAPVILTRGCHVVSYHIVVQGACWCRMAGMPAVRLEAGDILVIPHGDGYGLYSGPDQSAPLPVEPLLDWFRQMASGDLPSVVTEGGEGAPTLHVVCGFLGCDDLPFNPVLTALPRLLRIRPSGDRPETLGPLIDLIVAESRHRRAGRRSVLLRIGELLFVEVVRMHLATMDSEGRGWLAGLRDATVGRVLALMHREPQRKWTLDDLAHDCRHIAVGARRALLALRRRDTDALSREVAPAACRRSASGGQLESGVSRAGRGLRVRGRVQPGVQEGDRCRTVRVEARPGKHSPQRTTAIRPRITRTTRAFATARL